MYTHAPDETIYQCILYNSAFKDSLTGDNLCYLRWTGQPSPKTLTMDDWGDIKNQSSFCQKSSSHSKQRINKYSVFNNLDLL